MNYTSVTLRIMTIKTKALCCMLLFRLTFLLVFLHARQHVLRFSSFCKWNTIPFSTAYFDAFTGVYRLLLAIQLLPSLHPHNCHPDCYVLENECSHRQDLLNNCQKVVESLINVFKYTAFSS